MEGIFAQLREFIERATTTTVAPITAPTPSAPPASLSEAASPDPTPAPVAGLPPAHAPGPAWWQNPWLVTVTGTVIAGVLLYLFGIGG